MWISCFFSLIKFLVVINVIFFFWFSSHAGFARCKRFPELITFLGYSSYLFFFLSDIVLIHYRKDIIEINCDTNVSITNSLWHKGFCKTFQEINRKKLEEPTMVPLLLVEAWLLSVMGISVLAMLLLLVLALSLQGQVRRDIDDAWDRIAVRLFTKG